jgi:hypothetical protein
MDIQQVKGTMDHQVKCEYCESKSRKYIFPPKLLHLQYSPHPFHRILDDPLCSVFLMLRIRLWRNRANFR